MKTIIPVILLMFCTFFSAAQIVITAQEGAITTDKYQYTFIKNKGTALPDTGENIIWDYTYFEFCDDCDFKVQFERNKKKDLANIDFFIKNSLPLLGHPVPTIEYFGTNESGDIYGFGRSYKSKTLPLIRLTGHPMDRLRIEGQQKIEPVLEYDFPFEYGKKWETNSFDTLTFELNAPSINMKNIKIRQISEAVIKQEIVGFGQLKLPYLEDRKIKTFTYNALLLKKTSIEKSKFESDLSEADLEKILNLAGLETYSMIDCHFYKFYVRELPLFILTMSDCQEKGNIERVRMRSDLSKYPPKNK